MPNYKFAVCGVASAVRVLKVRQMPQVGVTTSILNPDALDKPSFGGPGFNVFYGLTKLGIPVYPVLTYSDQSFETEFARISQEYGAFPTEFLDGPPDNISSRVVMIQDANRDHITMATRYGAETSEPLLIPQRFEEIPFDACELVVLTIPRPENIGALFAAVKKSGKPMALCMRYDPCAFTHGLLWEMLTYSEIVFANACEADYIATEFGLDNVEDFMYRGNTHTLIVTRGKSGCSVYTRMDGTIIRTEVPVTKAPLGNVDAVGAGDGFITGYLYGLAVGRDPYICAQYGSTVSSFVIERDGSTTNLPTVQQLLERNNTREECT